MRSGTALAPWCAAAQSWAAGALVRVGSGAQLSRLCRGCEAASPWGFRRAAAPRSRGRSATNLRDRAALFSRCNFASSESDIGCAGGVGRWQKSPEATSRAAAPRRRPHLPFGRGISAGTAAAAPAAASVAASASSVAASGASSVAYLLPVLVPVHRRAPLLLLWIAEALESSCSRAQLS